MKNDIDITSKERSIIYEHGDGIRIQGIASYSLTAMVVFTLSVVPFMLAYSFAKTTLVESLYIASGAFFPFLILCILFDRENQTDHERYRRLKNVCKAVIERNSSKPSAIPREGPTKKPYDIHTFAIPRKGP